MPNYILHIYFCLINVYLKVHTLFTFISDNNKLITPSSYLCFVIFLLFIL